MWILVQIPLEMFRKYWLHVHFNQNWKSIFKNLSFSKELWVFQIELQDREQNWKTTAAGTAGLKSWLQMLALWNTWSSQQMSRPASQWAKYFPDTKSHIIRKEQQEASLDDPAHRKLSQGRKWQGPASDEDTICLRGQWLPWCFQLNIHISQTEGFPLQPAPS